MFKELYLGELKKILRLKTIIVMAVFLVLCFGFTCLMYSLMSVMEEASREAINEAAEADPSIITDGAEDFFDFSSMLPVYTAENIDGYIAAEEKAIEEAKQAKKDLKPAIFRGNGEIYFFKANLAVLRYIKANGLYGEDAPKSTMLLSCLFAETPEGFTYTFYTFWSVIIIYFSIVIASSSLSQEYKNGTLKLMLMRPITRTKLYLAKLSATASVSTVLLFLPTLLAYLYSLIVYKPSGELLLFVFNASKVFVAGEGYFLFLSLIFSWVTCMVMTQIAYSIGCLLRNNAAGIILSILITGGLVAGLFSSATVGALFLSNSLGSLSSFFQATDTGTASGSFYMNLLLILLYTAAAFVSSFFVFKKRDVA